MGHYSPLNSYEVEVTADDYSIPRCPGCAPTLSFFKPGSSDKRDMLHFSCENALFQADSQNTFIMPYAVFVSSGLEKYFKNLLTTNNTGVNMSAHVNSPAEQTFIIGSQSQSGQVSFAAKPVQHANLPAALDEAKRLAGQASNGRSTTKAYLIFQYTAVVTVEPAKKGF